MRIIAYALATIAVGWIMQGQPATAPPLPEGYQFHHAATLDRSQVIDPGPCTLRTFEYGGMTWGYCTERPSDVEVMVP